MLSNIKAFFKSFCYAFSGIICAVRTQRNMRFHLCAAATVLFMTRFYDFSAEQYCIIFLCIALVTGSELINTAVEASVDIASDGKYSDNAKKAKDCAAGAVLVCALFSAVCGIKLLYKPAVLAEAVYFFIQNKAAFIGGAAWLIFSFVFIFSDNIMRP